MMQASPVIIGALCLIGLAIDLWFIYSEYQKQMKKAVVLKGTAALFFVILGWYCQSVQPSFFGRLIVIGLLLGMLGDILLAMRYLYTGAKSNKVFAVGILAFLLGHFLYIAALLFMNSSILWIAVILTVVLAAISIPPLMKVITPPSQGLKYFGWVYLIIVIFMFSCSAGLVVKEGFNPFTILFCIGALLFMVSDFIMIYFSFGKNVKPLRAINLLTYYFGQLLIAISILFA